MLFKTSVALGALAAVAVAGGAAAAATARSEAPAAAPARSAAARAPASTSVRVCIEVLPVRSRVLLELKIAYNSYY